MLTENISALERFDALGVSPMDDDIAESGTEDVDRRIRTRIRPSVSISDSVRSGSRPPSREMTSSSSSNLEIEAAVRPGNWFWIRTTAALYSNRNSKSVYLQIYNNIIYSTLMINVNNVLINRK